MKAARVFLFFTVFFAGGTMPVAAQTFGAIHRIDPRIDELIPAEAKLEKLAEGFDWTEGPVWYPQEKCLLFTDIPKNTIYKWKEGEGISVFLRPAGYVGEDPRDRKSVV